MDRLDQWLKSVYEGTARQRRRAVALLHEQPCLFAGDPWLACAIGDAGELEAAIARNPTWVDARGGALGMPPLVAVTHSMLLLEPGFEAGLLACAALLLRHGAEANSSWIHPDFPDWPLSALYGAAGKTHHAGMLKLLLEAGAQVDDRESLYHSVESPEPTCTRMLLDAGARVVETNTIGHALDYDRLNVLEMLLARGGDAREKPWLHHAILRGRSLPHVRALVDAGADLRAQRDGISLYCWAQRFGRMDVVHLLEAAGVAEALSPADAFIAACARGDAAAAQAMGDLLPRLDASQLQALPELADVGNLAAVNAMVAVGWPLEVETGWQATALNMAVMRGDAAMAQALLQAGADWRTQHGFGDNAVGTLAWASLNEPDLEAPLDYPACARTLVKAGVPLQAMRGYEFSDAVEAYLAAI